MKNLLVAVDFEDTSHEALRVARTIAEALGARLHLLHIIPDVPTFWSFEAAEVDWEGLRNRWINEATQKLSEFDAPPASERATQIGRPSADIVRYADEHDIDMIVIGTHGQGPIKEMLLGSVAEKVVRSAHCPVLTVRPAAPDATD